MAYDRNWRRTKPREGCAGVGSPTTKVERKIKNENQYSVRVYVLHAAPSQGAQGIACASIARILPIDKGQPTPRKASTSWVTVPHVSDNIDWIKVPRPMPLMQGCKA